MTEEKSNNAMIAIIRIRGQTGIRKNISDTLNMLNLKTKFSCVVIPNTSSYTGMLKKVKDFVTWGEVSKETINQLDNKRKDGDNIYYRLHPPRGGFERKGTKKTFNIGGALGYRKEKINNLIMRML